MLSEQPRRLTFILGGARSGKSRYAEDLLAAEPGPWTYVATAQALDDEMKARIEHHRSRRTADWTTVEAPLELARTVGSRANGLSAILIDCLTLWLSNVMLAGRDPARETARLVAALRKARGNIVVVSNEVGMGIVPDNRLARDFRDAQGQLNRAVAEEADQVLFIAAGLPLTLK